MKISRDFLSDHSRSSRCADGASPIRARPEPNRRHRHRPTNSPSGAGVVSSTGNLQVSGSSVAITVTGTSSIQNDGMIKQTGTGRAIRDNTGGLTLTVTNNAGALLQAADADAIQMNRPNSSISFDNFGSVISLNASAGGSQAIDWNAITTGSNTLHNLSHGIYRSLRSGRRPPRSERQRYQRRNDQGGYQHREQQRRCRRAEQ